MCAPRLVSTFCVTRINIMNAAPQQQPVPDSSSTATVPTPPIVVPPPETHHLTAQPPQNFSMPAAPAVQSAVTNKQTPQMQPVIPASTDSATPSASSQEAYLPPTPPTYEPRKKKIPLKTILALLLAFVTILGGGAAYYLSQNSADLRQRAASDVYGTPVPPPPSTPIPPPATVPPPSSSTACSVGQFNCGSYSSDPAGCSSHAGQGCYYHAQSFSCKCGTGGGGDNNPTGATASCGGGKAHICAGSSSATFCVSSCSQGGNYSGDSCNFGCNSNCTDITVSANTCQDVGPGTSSCGRWQVDVHGAASCADSGCSNSGCGASDGGEKPPTPPPTTPPPVNAPPSASVGISQENCVNVRGKYQAGSTITFTGTGPATNTKTYLFLAKVDAAGTGLDPNFNSSCPIGVRGEDSAHFCKVSTTENNSPSAVWNTPQVGKYVIVSNGYTATAACSGNPTCTYNSGPNNPMTPVTCAGNFTSCSENDYKFFEVASVDSCTPAVCSYNPNIDGKNGVDIDDYVLFVQNVMKVGKNIPGDVNCSGRVDLDDYPYIIRNFSIQ